MANPEPLYLGLLGTAECFRTSNPPNIKLCIQCLQGVLNCKPPSRIEARTQLQLGTVLLNFTENYDSAKQHLEKAWSLAYPDPSLEDVKYESVSVLAELLIRQGDSTNAYSLLHKAVEISHQSHFWKCRLLFQLCQQYVRDKDYATAYQLLGNGCYYARSIQSQHTELLFLLSKGLIALLMNNQQETSTVMSTCGPMITSYNGSLESKEMLKAFFLTLQVTHYISCGMIKSVKTLLRQLQDCIQTLTTMEDTTANFNPAGQANEVFQWMPKEHLCVLVYLVTVYHSLQGGYVDKAQKYSEKALAQIEGLKTLDDSPLLTSFQVMLLENIIQCHISSGSNTHAIAEISRLKFVCLTDSTLLQAHKSQLHTLLGLYSMAMNCMDNAIQQFQTALQTCTETDRHLYTFISLNLGIVYARTNRINEFMSLLEQIHPQRVPQESYTLKAAATYVYALQRFFQTQFEEAKMFIQETLKFADTEDLNKLTACSLVLLGQIFLHMGRTHEVLGMVNPALQLAQKIPEVNIQMWGTTLLRDFYRLFRDAREVQESQVLQQLTHSLIADHQQALENPEHSLIYWLGELNHGHSGVAVGTSAYANHSNHHNGSSSVYL